jgi:hypothetical protein
MCNNLTCTTMAKTICVVVQSQHTVFKVCDFLCSNLAGWFWNIFWIIWWLQIVQGESSTCLLFHERYHRFNPTFMSQTFHICNSIACYSSNVSVAEQNGTLWWQLWTLAATWSSDQGRMVILLCIEIILQVASSFFWNHWGQQVSTLMKVIEANHMYPGRMQMGIHSCWSCLWFRRLVHSAHDVYLNFGWYGNRQQITST